jgi:hypothetical protein
MWRKRRQFLLYFFLVISHASSLRIGIFFATRKSFSITLDSGSRRLDVPEDERDGKKSQRTTSSLHAVSFPSGDDSQLIAVNKTSRTFRACMESSPA